MARAFRVDTKQLKKFERLLMDLNRQGLPYAAREAVNGQAFEARKEWRTEIAKDFTLRNKFTQNSVQYDKAKNLNWARLQSQVGSVADYMVTQEHGGQVGPATAAKGKPIPTPSARIGGSDKRMVSRPNRVANISLKPRRGKTDKAANVDQLWRARRDGRKYVLLEKGNRRGIYKLHGKTKVKMVQNLSRASVRIKAQPTMQPAVERATPRGGWYYKRGLVRQLQRTRAFK